MAGNFRLRTQEHCLSTVVDARTSSGSAAPVTPPDGSSTGLLRLRDRARARSGIVEVLMVRIGREHFAVELRSVDEAVEEPSLRLVPEGAAGLLGVFALRGQMLALFSPGRILGTMSDSDTPSTALVMRAGNRRIGIAVDEAEDVVRFDLSTLREAPAQETSDGILLGLLWRDRDLIGLLDSRALISACLSIPVPSVT